MRRLRGDFRWIHTTSYTASIWLTCIHGKPPKGIFRQHIAFGKFSSSDTSMGTTIHGGQTVSINYLLAGDEDHLYVVPATNLILHYCNIQSQVSSSFTTTLSGENRFSRRIPHASYLYPTSPATNDSIYK